MSKYIPTKEIPERGDVLCIPYEILYAMRKMPDDERLKFFTAQTDWMIQYQDPYDLGILEDQLFKRWKDYQLRMANSAREQQERAKAAIAKRWEKTPPPTR